ncbi:MAG: hypothetical protein ERJ68_01750 [Aphanocapsa feldmannii 277cI]|uniref:Uncharacterized protein n=1 Tax=Aphanocapsa feldmannii 277cI TaxID=2507554 RepID=A0A524RV62_9CHRO|nr:MAG: hypothetical protein ERJ68_01750 [Aphanocapsa feldmannii 277cI]
MQQALFGGLAVILIGGALWLKGRRSAPPTGAEPCTSQAAISAVRTAAGPSLDQVSGSQATADPLSMAVVATAARPDSRQPAAIPLQPRDRAARLQRLQQCFATGDGKRVEALEEAIAWGDRCCLPLFRLGLRDPDGVVVQLAARGITLFRGPLAVADPVDTAQHLPLNTALIR